MEDDSDSHDPDEIVEFPITDTLDLHTFAPRDVAELVHDWLDECVTRGFRDVRIIHGKGQGVLRRIVHSALDKHPAVVSYGLADALRGGWGATVVQLTGGGKPAE